MGGTLLRKGEFFSALSRFVEVPTSFHLTSDVLDCRVLKNWVIVSTKDFAQEFSKKT